VSKQTCVSGNSVETDACIPLILNGNSNFAKWMETAMETAGNRNSQVFCFLRKQVVRYRAGNLAAARYHRR
jgi:hypothetical protein